MLAIAGGKGGCGKTTTTYRLAVALARLGDTPLAVDADVEMPDLHLLADVPPDPGLGAVTDGRRPRAAGHRLHQASGATVLPAGDVDPAGVPAALDRLRPVDGQVLVDCPAGAGRDAARPLRAARRTLVVTTPSAQALRDAAKTAAMARELDAEPVGAVVVERDCTPADAQDVTDDRARRLFACPVLARIPAHGTETPLPRPVRTQYDSIAKRLHERNV